MDSLRERLTKRNINMDTHPGTRRFQNWRRTSPQDILRDHERLRESAADSIDRRPVQNH